jgi:mannose-6-phosphate isomerase-like protein (cupin superfamily)
MHKEFYVQMVFIMVACFRRNVIVFEDELIMGPGFRLHKQGQRNMIIKDLQSCHEVVAGDHSLLREIFNPRKEKLPLRYSLAYAIIKPGQITYKHRLKSSEVYYILEGEGEMHIDDETARVNPGQAVYIPPDSVQFIDNIGKVDLIFLCIVDPAWQAGDEQILE